MGSPCQHRSNLDLRDLSKDQLDQLRCVRTVSRRAPLRLCFLQLAGIGGLARPALDVYQFGNQHGLPPAAHASLLSDSQGARIFLCGLRSPDPRRRSDFLGRDHRIHHQRSDQPGDPHSPRDGAWWAHMGWLLVGESKHADTPLMSKYAPDLAKDRFYVWLNDYALDPDGGAGGAAVWVGGFPSCFGASSCAWWWGCTSPG